MVDVHRVLSDVPEPHLAFWFHNGVIAHNLHELAQDIAALPKNVFEFHANSEKNDFYKWILDVFGDDVLARKIKGIKKPSECAARIKKRLHDLESQPQ